MSISRIYSPTPLFLYPGIKGKNVEITLYHGFNNNKYSISDFFAKGRDCLSFLIKSMKAVNPTRDEIVIPSYNAHSLAIASIFNNMKIRLVDITPEFFFPAPEKYQQVINSNTLLVILPYNYGIIPPIEWINEIKGVCKKNGSYIIDDFASTMPGGEYLDYFNESGEIFLFSLGKTKILTLMDGGFYAIDKSSKYLENLNIQLDIDRKSLRTNKKIGFFLGKFFGNIIYNIYCSKTGNSFLSYIGQTQKERLPDSLEISHNILNKNWKSTYEYINNKYFMKSTSYRRLINSKYFELINKSEKYFFFESLKINAGSRFPVLFKNKSYREKAVELFEMNGIGVSKGFVKWLGEFSLISNFIDKTKPDDYKNGKDFQDRFLTLPSHLKVRETDIEKVARIFEKLDGMIL